MSLFLSSCLTIHVSVVKVRQQISTWEKFLFSMKKVLLSCLKHCYVWSTTTEFPLNAGCFTFKNCKGQMGKSYWYALGNVLPLVFWLWICGLAGELKTLVRRAEWRVWEEQELLTHFCASVCCEDGGLHQHGDVTECKSVLLRFFHPGSISGHNSLSFCPEGAFASLLVQYLFQDHADGFGSQYLEWGGQKKLLLSLPVLPFSF